MEHTAKDEASCWHRCTLPLTARGVVDMVITELGVFEIDRSGGGMELIEIARDVPLARSGRRPRPHSGSVRDWSECRPFGALLQGLPRRTTVT